MLLHGNNTIFSLSALYFFKTRQQLIYIFIIEINVLNQSLTNLKNPAKGTKGILVNGGSPLSRDFLLCYTLQSTNTAYSGAYISINGITVAQLTSQSANCKQTIVGSVRAFKGDIISITISNFGGDASVYAYC